MEHIEKSEMEATGDLDFWKKHWFSPSEVSQFLNLSSEIDEAKGRIWYICSLYRQAYQVLINFIWTEYKFLSSVPIGQKDLEIDEIKALVSIRDLWSQGKYEQCVNRQRKLSEKKLHAFLFNTFSILYGDMAARMQNIDPRLKGKDQIKLGPVGAGGWKAESNEFTTLTLEEMLVSIVEGGSEIGSRNWEHVFSHIFSPITSVEIKKHFSYHAETENSSEAGAVTNQTSLDMRDHLMFTIEFIRKINNAYALLLSKGANLSTLSGTISITLSYDGMRDKPHLTSIPLLPAVVSVIESRLESGLVRLDDPQFTQEYYGVPYRSFFAFLTLACSEKSKELGMATRFRMNESNGSKVMIRRVKKVDVPPNTRVFLCHSSVDKDFARTLAEDLKENAIQVWFDEYEIKVGHSITQRINEALKENDFLAIILTPDAVCSEWVQRELSYGMVRELETKRVVILPILLKLCDILPLIKDKRYADFSKNYDKGIGELLEAIRSHRQSSTELSTN